MECSFPHVASANQNTSDFDLFARWHKSLHSAVPKMLYIFGIITNSSCLWETYARYFRVRTDEHVAVSYVKLTANLEMNS